MKSTIIIQIWPGVMAPLCVFWKIMTHFSSQLLFQRFVEGKVPLADFLDSFHGLRKLQHISLILLKKLQEATEVRPPQRLSQVQPDSQCLSGAFPDQIHNLCLPVCGLSTAVLLLPFDPHVSSGLCPTGNCFHQPEFLPAGRRGPGQKWPSRAVRLQPLNLQHSRHHQGPQWGLIRGQIHRENSINYVRMFLLVKSFIMFWWDVSWSFSVCGVCMFCTCLCGFPPNSSPLKTCFGDS